MEMGKKKKEEVTDSGMSKFTEFVTKTVTAYNKKQRANIEKIEEKKKNGEKIKKKKDEPRELTVAEWLLKTAKLAESCIFITHNSKYTDSYTKSFIRIEPNTDENSCYVSTSTISSQLDVFLKKGAATSPTAKLLLLKLEDGKMVHEHILTDDYLREDIEKLGANYDEIRELLKKSYQPIKKEDMTTDCKLRQVFFPIASNDYHVLTIIPPSNIIQEVHKRILYRNSNTITDENLLPFINRTITKYGGTHPQNISSNNSSLAGFGSMIMSIPPVVKRKYLRIPKYNFFTECLSYRDFEPTFSFLHKYYCLNRNNKKIRVLLRNAENSIMEKLLLVAYQLREEKNGWSDNKKLRQTQAIFLDDKYADLRKDEDWQNDISTEVSNWIVKTYLYRQKEGVKLGEGEIHAFRDEMRELIREDLRLQERNCSL